VIPPENIRPARIFSQPESRLGIPTVRRQRLAARGVEPRCFLPPSGPELNPIERVCRDRSMTSVSSCPQMWIYNKITWAVVVGLRCAAITSDHRVYLCGSCDQCTMLIAKAYYLTLYIESYRKMYRLFNGYQSHQALDLGIAYHKSASSPKIAL
jgi:hypothetical protein